MSSDRIELPLNHLYRRNTNISPGELYGKLHEDKPYLRRPGSLYRVFFDSAFAKGLNPQRKSLGTTSRTTTPTTIGVKWLYKFPEFKTTYRWAKASAQEFSDTMVEAFKDKLKDI